MDTKTQFYRSSGAGRDSYIYVNNGGLSVSMQPMQEVEVTSFRERRRNKAVIGSGNQVKVRYRANGSGRDGYISVNSGGFEEKGRNYSPGATFYRSLRGRNGSVGESVAVQRTWLPIHQRLLLSERYHQQCQLTQRLSTRRSSLPSS